MVTVQQLLQYILEGDYLGFLQACYVSAFQSADIFYAVLILLFTVPLYIRTKSIMLLCILWVMLGTIVIVATPLVSGMAILITTMGIGGLFYKLYITVRS